MTALFFFHEFKPIRKLYFHVRGEFIQQALHKISRVATGVFLFEHREREIDNRFLLKRTVAGG
jgi:hypothetical protein